MSEPLPVPVLTGELVTLRPHRASDLDAVYARCLDEDTRRYTTIPLEYTREMAQEYLTGLLEPSAEQVSWAIEVEGRVCRHDRPADDARRGRCGRPGVRHAPGLPRPRGDVAGCGAGRGHALDTLGWQLVRWEAHAGNWASAKAVWRTGFPVPTFVPDLLSNGPGRRRLDQHPAHRRRPRAGGVVGRRVAADPVSLVPRKRFSDTGLRPRSPTRAVRGAAGRGLGAGRAGRLVRSRRGVARPGPGRPGS